MGFLATRWEATHEGRSFTIDRNELTKGFAISSEGAVIAQKRWSTIGTGELEGTVVLGGRSVTVKVKLELSFKNKCLLWVDAVEVPCRQVS